MTIENLPVTVDFVDKDFGNEPIPGFPRLNIKYPAEILDFKETAKDLVAKHFKKGCETIYPLIKGKTSDQS